MYIYIYFTFVRLRHQTIGWCLLPYYIPSVTQYAFQNIKFLYNMQCVIDISHCSQKMQGSMRIGTFLEARKNNVEGTCCLQAAICLQIRNTIHAKKLYENCGKMQCIILFNEVKPQSHFNEIKPQSHLPPWHLSLTKGLCFFKKKYHKDKPIPEINALFLQKYNM